MGSTAGASGLAIGTCYRTNAGNVNMNSDYAAGLTIPANNRLLFTTDGRMTGLTGTYDFGICYSTSNTNWNDNGVWRFTLTVFK
jgi:hypothetical protein